MIGLGGTSLLNANVFLEADSKSLAMDAWPEALRKPGALDKCMSLPKLNGNYVDDRHKDYNLAQHVLQPEPYPKDFPTLPKMELLKKQADALGLGDRFYCVPQTTRFENGPNRTGVDMQASTLTGMDSTGVNDGSKSSTLVNYLADAWNWGAELYEALIRVSDEQLTYVGFATARSATSRSIRRAKDTWYSSPGTAARGPSSMRTSTATSCGFMRRNLFSWEPVLSEPQRYF